MDAADALLNRHRIPRQVVVEKHSGDLKIDTFATRGGGNQDARTVLFPELLRGGDFILQRPALDAHDHLRPYDAPELSLQKFKRLSVLSEDNKSLVGILAAQLTDDGLQALKLPIYSFRNNPQQLPHFRGFVGDFGIGINAVVALLIGIEGPVRFVFRFDQLLERALAHLGNAGIGLGVRRRRRRKGVDFSGRFFS